MVDEAHPSVSIQAQIRRQAIIPGHHDSAQTFGDVIAYRGIKTVGLLPHFISHLQKAFAAFVHRGIEPQFAMRDGAIMATGFTSARQGRERRNGLLAHAVTIGILSTPSK